MISADPKSRLLASRKTKKTKAGQNIWLAEMMKKIKCSTACLELGLPEHLARDAFLQHCLQVFGEKHMRN